MIINFHNFNNFAFIPHGHCYLWNPELVRLHVVSDGLTALAYFSIPIALIYFVQRRRDLPYPWLFLLFGAFIVACGLTHVMEVWTLWYPTYWLAGGLKAATALVSLTTAGTLIPTIPKALSLPNRSELETARVELERQVSERTRSLSESEERLQLALDASGEGLWDWNIATGEVYLNDRYQEMLGYASGELVMDLAVWEHLIHPDDQTWVVERLKAHLSDPSIRYAFDYRVRCKSGEWKWVANYGKVVAHDKQGKPLRMIGVHIDISDRKAIEAALAASQQRYQNLVENSPDIIERFDLELRHLYVSPVLTAITGIETDMFTGKTCRELGMDEDMVNAWEVAAAKLLASGERQTVEFSAPTLAGVRSFEMAIAPEWTEDRAIQSILCISRDITDRKVTAQALKTQRDFNQLIAEITSRFVDVSFDRINAEIEQSLQLISEVMQVDTSYLFRFNADDCTMSMTHEWCQPHCPRQISVAQNIPFAAFPWANAKLNRQEIVFVPNTAALPPEASIDQIGFQQFNLVAVLSVPLVIRNSVNGAIGFASFSQPFIWDDETIRLLRILAQTIANAQQQIQDEQQLAISEERLRLALAAANQGLYDINIQTGAVIVSPEYALMLGHDPATFKETATQWIERLHPDDRVLAANTYQAYVAGSIPEYKAEFRLQTQTGDYKWILSVGKIVSWDEDGRPLRMLGTHTDITERKRAAADLQASEERLRLALEAAKQGMYDIDLRTNTGIVSPEYIEMLGYTPEEFDYTAQGWLDRLHPDERDTVFQVYKDYIAGKRADYQIEFRQRTKAGDYKWILSLGKMVAWDDQGIPSRMIGTHTDITERKQYENQLRELSTRLDLAVQTAKMGIWDWDIVTDRQVWNDRTYELYGLPIGGDVTYASWQSVIHPDDVAACHAASEKACKEAGEGKVEFRVVRPDGSLRYIESYFLVQRDANGQAVRMLGVNLDVSDRKKAEEARFQAEKLRLELNLLERILDTVLAGYWDWDIPNHQEYMSPGLKQMLGYEDYELPNIPETWQKLIFAEDLPGVLSCFDRHVQSRGAVPFYNEVRYHHKNGSVVWVICAGQVIDWNAAGQPVRMIGCHVDITKLKQVEAQLQKNEAHLQQAQRIGKLGSWEFDLVTEQITWSHQVFCIFGRDPALGSPKNVQELQQLFHPDDRALHRQAVETAITTAQPYDVECRACQPDGTLVYIQAKGEPVLNAAGQVVQLTGTVLDITDRKQAEAQLRDLSVRLMLALQSGAIGVWDWTLDQNLYWDERVYEIYGLQNPGRPLILQDWRDRVHPDDLVAVEAEQQAVFRGERNYSVEFRIRRTDGELRWIKSEAILQRNEKGEASQMIGINYDITDRKQAEAQLLQTTAQLEASNQELEAFAYSVSHDLRAPLRAIDGFSKALLEDYSEQLDEEGKYYFDRIRHNVQRMGMLIDDLLSLSRVSRYEMQPRAVNLSELVQEQANDLQAANPERAVKFIIAPGASVSADPTLMRVVLNNLLANAWKFTSHHSSACIEFGIIKQDDQLTYFVRDDGAGFDMTYASKLFGVFQRLHNTNEFPGTGIGLAIVQRAIHRHGGKVWAHAAIEQGATIYFTIPDPSTRARV